MMVGPPLVGWTSERLSRIVRAAREKGTPRWGVRYRLKHPEILPEVVPFQVL